MKLSEVPDFEALCTSLPLPPVTFKSVCCDSRKVTPGDLFVAIRGTRELGSRYAESACRNGAVAVVSDTPLNRELGVPVIQVDDARRALPLLAATAEGNPSSALKLFGITGTNGKTTTAWILRDLLAAASFTPGLITTVQTSYPGHTEASSRTTPDACDLQRLLREMVTAGCDCAVMEVSSHALDQHRVAATTFAGAIFTNLTQDHLDYHFTMEAYFEAKKKLFFQLAERSPGAPAVAFLDAPFGKEMASYIRTLPLRRITCGMENESSPESRVSDIEMDAEGCRFIWHSPDGNDYPASLPLTGRYNVANALCAMSLAWASGISSETIVSTLPSLHPRWGRLERVKTPLPCSIFVDYAHTDDALTHVLGALREISSKRLTVLFGCGGDRDRTKRPLMGQACFRSADKLIVTSDNPRGEDPRTIIRDILNGIPDSPNVHALPDRREAIRYALTHCEPGEILLVAGKGHETTQEIAGRFYPFDDRKVILEEAERIAAAGTGK